MPDEENIILEFPIDNKEIDLGFAITFDNIGGLLPIPRIEGVSGLLSANEAHDIWDNI